MKKTAFRILGIFLAIVVVAVLLNIGTIKKLRHVMTLFDEENIVENFLNMEKSFDHTSLPPSPDPFLLPRRSGNGYALPQSFTWNDSVFDVARYLQTVNTTGLLVIHRDTIVYESYFNGMTDSTTHISWSVAKSFISALVGIALEDGLFESVEDPITKYLPELSASGYNGVRIKDVLQMSTGVRFNEDYRDFNSDINRFGRTFALGKSFDEFVMGMKREREPGTYNHYVSINTQALGMLVTRVTGKSITEYMQEKLWNPAGMEHQAQWVTDKKGMELALGGFNATLRDYGRMGLLYLHEGRNHRGEQVVPATWIRESVTPDNAHLEPGPNELSDSDFGYGYQWWIPENPDGEFFAAGIYNQYIYVYPKKSLVIVKLSANHLFKLPGDRSKEIHVALLRTLAEDFPLNEPVASDSTLANQTLTE